MFCGFRAGFGFCCFGLNLGVWGWYKTSFCYIWINLSLFGWWFDFCLFWYDDLDDWCLNYWISDFVCWLNLCTVCWRFVFVCLVGRICGYLIIVFLCSLKLLYFGLLIVDVSRLIVILVGCCLCILLSGVDLRVGGGYYLADCLGLVLELLICFCLYCCFFVFELFLLFDFIMLCSGLFGCWRLIA